MKRVLYGSVLILPFLVLLLGTFLIDWLFEIATSVLLAMLYLMTFVIAGSVAVVGVAMIGIVFIVRRGRCL